jgi:hypothetical protein
VKAGPLDAVAVILHMLFCGAEAVNKPDASMLPQEAAQVTLPFALNCCVCPCPVAALGGVIVSGEVTVALAVEVLGVP